MQVVVDGGAVAGHFGECFGEFEAVGNEDIAAELTLCSSGASNACENPLCLFSRAMRDTGNIGYLLARHVEDDAAASMPTTRSAMRSKSLVMWLESSTPRSPVEA